MENFKRKASALGVKLSDKQLDQFRQYYEMLVEKNKVMNLTAITEWEEVIDRLSKSLNEILELAKEDGNADIIRGALKMGEK